jgi:hypothetical protein
MRVRAAVSWNNGVMEFRPFSLPYVIVTRQMQGDQLVWQYPSLGAVRMERICRVPAVR